MPWLRDPKFFNCFHRYSASDATGYVADVRYEGSIKPFIPKPPVVAPILGAPIPHGLPIRPIHKRKVQSLANQEKRNKRKQQAKKQQQQGSIQFQKDDGWTQVPTYGFQEEE